MVDCVLSSSGYLNFIERSADLILTTSANGDDDLDYFASTEL